MSDNPESTTPTEPEAAQPEAPKPQPPAASRPTPNPWEEVFAGQTPEQVKAEVDRSREWERRSKRTVEEVKAELGFTDVEQAVEAGKKGVTEAFREAAQLFAGIPEDDANLFLTGSDKDTLSKQAARLAEKFAQQQPKGGHVPAEGRTPEALALNSNGLEQALKSKLGIV